MEIKCALRAVSAASAIALAAPGAASERGETVAPHFERVIPNIPGKLLVALVVDYAPGGASLSHTHAKSAFIFAYVVPSGELTWPSTWTDRLNRDRTPEQPSTWESPMSFRFITKSVHAYL